MLSILLLNIFSILKDFRTIEIVFSILIQEMYLLKFNVRNILLHDVINLKMLGNLRNS